MLANFYSLIFIIELHLYHSYHLSFSSGILSTSDILLKIYAHFLG